MMSLPLTMAGAVLIGHGGLATLQCQSQSVSVTKKDAVSRNARDGVLG